MKTILLKKKVINVNGLLENMVEISKDDKRLLKTVEESTIKSGDHYVVLLPFKKDNQITESRQSKG